MTRLPRIGSVVAGCLILSACGQLLGLSDYDTEEGTAGRSGSSAAGRGGSAGSAQAGSGGASGTAGTAGSAGFSGGGSGKGGRDGSGGSSTDGGAAGEAGAGASGGSKGGGTSGGTGGTAGTNAEAGMGGQGGCSSTVEIHLVGSVTTDVEYQYANYEYNLDPQIQSPAVDYLWVDFYTGGEYTGDATGTFDLGQGDDANYASCSRCIRVAADYDTENGATTTYFAKSGTLQIASDSVQMEGYPDAHLSDVLFTEVTINSTNNVSTEVFGGRCLHLTSADVLIAPPVTAPEGWLCADYAYGGGALDGCDCGCGLVDPDCASELVGACEHCHDAGSCGTTCADIALNDNSQCASDQGWTCDPAKYGDGSACDCGCGIVDYDCLGTDSSYCDACDDAGACTASLTASCSDIATSDNSQCQ